jgi:hypothetical protein
MNGENDEMTDERIMRGKERSGRDKGSKKGESSDDSMEK